MPDGSDEKIEGLSEEDQRLWLASSDIPRCQEQCRQKAREWSENRSRPEASRVRPIRKPLPPGEFYNYENNAEMRWEALAHRGYLVPNDLFYVRSQTRTPEIDPNSWRLCVEGPGIRTPMTLTYEDLLNLPSVSVIRAIECAGNGRSLFKMVQGRNVPGTQWKLGAVGVAAWTGVPLREILESAGLNENALEVLSAGLDDLKVDRPIPVSKAMDDTLVVYGMNGEPLPPDHGFPVRLVVPGWAGIANIKWLGRLCVATEPVYTRWNTEKYVLKGPGYPPQPPAQGPALQEMDIKSAFELPWGASLPVGPLRLQGRSWSSSGAILRVDVSVDGGANWTEARLKAPNLPQAWVRWDLDWNAAPGQYLLQARATDDQGHTQPDAVPFNEEGYMYGGVAGHPVSVKGSENGH